MVKVAISRQQLPLPYEACHIGSARDNNIRVVTLNGYRLDEYEVVLGVSERQALTIQHEPDDMLVGIVAGALEHLCKCVRMVLPIIPIKLNFKYFHLVAVAHDLRQRRL